MKVYFDKPAGLWTEQKTETEEHRFAFQQLTCALLKTNLPFEAMENRPGLDKSINKWMRDGIYYTYHSEQPGPFSYCFKRGPLPFLWHMDPCGYSGWSEIATSPEAQDRAAEFDLAQAHRIIARHLTEMQAHNLSLLPQPERNDQDGLQDLQDFVFYPLQVNNDMVLKLADIPQFEAIQTAAHLAGEHKRHLVLKRHPLCTSTLIAQILADVQMLPFVHVSEASANTLMERCGAVLVTNSSLGLHGLIWGRPVFSMGRSEYAHMSHRLKTAADIAKAFDPVSPVMPDRWTRQLGHLLSEDLVDIRASEQITARVRRHVQDAMQKNIMDPPQKPAGAPPKLDDSTKWFTSYVRRLERETREQLDFVLARFAKMSLDEREELHNVLAGLARNESYMPRILEHTDPIVALKCLRFFHARDQMERVRQVIELQLKQPKAPAAELFPYARWLRQNGFPAQAMPLFEEIAAKDEATDLHLRVACSALLGATVPVPERALALAKRAVDLAPETVENHYWLASAALETGDTVLARSALQTVLSRDPDHVAGRKLELWLPAPAPKPEPKPKVSTPKPKASTETARSAKTSAKKKTTKDASSSKS